jgi:hypothetical protein
VTFSRGESSFKSLDFIGGGVDTGGSKAGKNALVYYRMDGVFIYDRMDGVFIALSPLSPRSLSPASP